MELQEIRSKTLGELADDLGEVLTAGDYVTIEALSTCTRQQLLGVDEKVALSALLMAVINTLGHEEPALHNLTTK
jgi:hypothetical protein